MGWALTIETGQLAKQANGAVLGYGDTVVLSTATASKEPRDPDYQEDSKENLKR